MKISLQASRLCVEDLGPGLRGLVGLGLVVTRHLREVARESTSDHSWGLSHRQTKLLDGLRAVVDCRPVMGKRRKRARCSRNGSTRGLGGKEVRNDHVPHYYLPLQEVTRKLSCHVRPQGQRIAVQPVHNPVRTRTTCNVGIIIPPAG